MAARRHIVVLLVATLLPLASSYLLDFIRPPIPLAHRSHARSAVRLMADAADEPGGELSISAGEMDALRARIAKIQENGGAIATPSQKFFDLAMSKPPQVLMQEFFMTRSPTVVTAMQEAVASLLGALPPFEFDAQVTTTGDKLAALMLQLQMTGYMLRNAEYVITMRSLLQLKTRSSSEYREAFERLDLDGSGFIEVGEVETMLKDVYPDGVPPLEVAAFLKLFDNDGDGRISWDEFAAALGAMDADGDGASPMSEAVALLAMPEDSESLASEPTVNGTVVVELDGGTSIEMDAAKYMSELKQEALALRQALRTAEDQKLQNQAALGSSLSAYVSSLPEDQLKLLTKGISEDVVTAMKQLVTYILRAPDGEGALDKDATVTMEQQKLQQLCLYQLVLGYTLREAEATGEAEESVGR